MIKSRFSKKKKKRAAVLKYIVLLKHCEGTIPASFVVPASADVVVVAYWSEEVSLICVKTSVYIVLAFNPLQSNVVFPSG